MDKKDMVNGLSDMLNTIAQSPIYQYAVAQQEQELFRKKLTAYHKNEFCLTNKQIESLIESVASGKNTYKDIQNIIPEMNSPTMCSYLCDDPIEDHDQCSSKIGMSMPLPLNVHSRICYFQFEKTPDDFYYLYEFKPSDTFALSISGENILLELQKEQGLINLSKQSIASANSAVFWAKVAIAVSVALFVIEKLLH